MHKKILVVLFLCCLFFPVISFAGVAPDSVQTFILEQIKKQEEYQKLPPEKKQQIEDEIKKSPQEFETIVPIGSVPCKQEDLNKSFDLNENVSPKEKAQIEDLRLSFESGKLFLSTCLRMDGPVPMKDAELVFTLSDAKGKTLRVVSSKGAVISMPMLAKKEVDSDGIISDSFTLKAELKKDGQAFDIKEKTYVCQELDANLCLKTVKVSAEKGSFFARTWIKILILATLICFVVFLGWLVFKKNNLSGRRMLFFLAFGLLGLFAPNMGRASEGVFFNYLCFTYVMSGICYEILETYTCPVGEAGWKLDKSNGIVWNSSGIYYFEGVGTWDYSCHGLPMDGGWSDWSECVAGFKTRTCTNPAPSIGGLPCVGIDRQICGRAATGISLESYVSDDHADGWNQHETVSAQVGDWTDWVGDDGNAVDSDDQGFEVRAKIDGMAGAKLTLESYTAADHAGWWNLHDIVSASIGDWTGWTGDDGNVTHRDDQGFKVRALLEDNSAGDYAGCTLSLESWTSRDHGDSLNLHEVFSASVGNWTDWVGDDGNSSDSDDQRFQMRMKIDCPFITNNCAAETCADKTCWNGAANVAGVKPINLGFFTCSYNDTVDCSLAANCGKTNTKEARCGAVRGCDGQSVYGLPLSDCVNADVPCSDIPAKCPGCQLEIKKGGWLEVAP